MSRLTTEYLESLGLDADAIESITQKQAAKAPPRTHFKHWVYLTAEQAQTLAELYGDDPEFRITKYSHVRKARKEKTELDRISI